MAEVAVSLASLAVEQLLPLLREEANLLKGIHKEFADIKDELESMQAFLKDADRRAAAGKGDNGSSEGVKTWVKQVIEAAFRIEGIIDKYMVYVAQQQPRHPGFAASLRRIAHLIKTLIPRHQIASEIQGIKSSVCEINERSKRYHFQIQPSLEQNAKWHDPRMDCLYKEEAEVVGFEGPKNRLIDSLVKGGAERTVISLVGMGGRGKTTLARKVFDSKAVVGHFDCRVWITVSQPYSIEGLLRDMLHNFYKQTSDSPPQDIVKMNRLTLIDQVRNFLQQKRYVVVFDDVWNIHFWNEIESAVIDNKKGSKIFITTRNLNVAESCKKSSFVEVHELQPLTKEQSLELFNKKAFQFYSGGCCPRDLTDISSNIVNKCKGLPLAIVAIGGLLSTKEKDAFEWQRFSENLSSEIKDDSHLTGINEILGLSYDDLPYYLKPCLLYFGIYPEDYEVKSNRMIRQWIAKGFVKEEEGKTLEQVAEGYLTELIGRSLVQVSSIKIDGKVKSCRVHDLIRVMILKKFEDLSFCKHISEDDRSFLSGRIRRLSATTTSNDLMAYIESTDVRSLLVFTSHASAIRNSVNRIPAKYTLLKVLDFEDAPNFHVPKNLGNLIHLKYLSFRSITSACANRLSKFIATLQNLETLDARGTNIGGLPLVIRKLRKLRHVRYDEVCLNQLKDGIGSMTSLQTLCDVVLSGDADEQLKVIKELGKLKKLRKLGLRHVRREHGSALSSSINEMQHLEKLRIDNIFSSEAVIDLNLNPSSSMLRNITLRGKLEKLPEWIPQLQNLVKLKLVFSGLTDDPVKSLKDMPNLLSLSITNGAYKGESLHFQDGGFQKLKELYIRDSDSLKSIVIDKGALHSLKRLELSNVPQLKTAPTGIQYLEKLQVLSNFEMPTKSVKSTTPSRPIIAPPRNQKSFFKKKGVGLPCYGISDFSA